MGRAAQPLRLVLLTSLTMIAFAANSVLNRLALATGDIDPMSFGVVRLVSGAVALVALVSLLRGRSALKGPWRGNGVIALTIYIFGFSLAYLSLDAGLGALILFGAVQMTMFAGALKAGERPTARQWIGSALALAGLAWLLLPRGVPGDVALFPAAMMLAAGVGWGLYSLAGRSTKDGLRATMVNFVLAVPLGCAYLLGGALAGDLEVTLTARGLWLAVLSGAVTSGMGYALWYGLLPRLNTAVAAVSQLTVPMIAAAGGLLFLQEALSARFALASALILIGVALAVIRPKPVGPRPQ